MLSKGPSIGSPESESKSRTRRVLDALYSATSIGACGGMLLVLIFVAMQMFSRMLEVVVPGVDDLAAYCFVLVLFFSLAPALKSGAHIRVQLILNAFPTRVAWIIDALCHVVAIGLTLYFSYWAINFAHQSYKFGDLASGLLKTPLWVPNSAMGIGLVLFLVALIDELFLTVRAGLASKRAIGPHHEQTEVEES